MAADESNNGLLGIPSDREGVRRVVLIICVTVAVVAVTAVGVWALWFRDGEPGQVAEGDGAYEHAQPTGSSASTATASGTPTVAAEPTTATPGAAAQPPTGTATPAKPSPVPAGRQPFIAYRFGGRIVIAREDGSSSKTVADSAVGVFALSPDAETLALVDFSTGKLTLVDAAGSKDVVVGTAAQVVPVWSADSARVLFVRDGANHSQSICQVSRAGTGAKTLGAGGRGAISPDGRVIALAASPLATGNDAAKVVLLRDGKPWRVLTAPGPVTDVTLAAAQAYVAVAPGTTPEGGPTEGVWALSFDPAARPERLVQPGAAGERGILGMLALAPDARHLAYSRAGDDGYSRMEIVATGGGAPVSVSARKDTYPMGWSADSSTALFIEGNAWQGEPTSLARIRADGTGKTVLVKGAGR